jgi:RimJ/RimL family protein N-acetyltransferase
MPATDDARSTPDTLLVSAEGQTWLVGDSVYLRPPAPADADLVQSWTFARFPISPDRIRARIDDGETGDDSGKGKQQLLIVRRSDERPVGSLLIYTSWFPHFHVDATVDPLFGQDAGRWKGEALALVMPMIIDEWQTPVVSVSLREDEEEAIRQLERIGARVCLRLPETFARDGVRTGSVTYELLNSSWIARLGDPAAVEQPRAGTGEARPVTPAQVPDADPPANAVRIGPRTYLRPIQKNDSGITAHWRLRETDTNWSMGRFAESPDAWWNEVKEQQKSTPHEWVRFAVCLRENDAVIGFVGIEDIDYRHRIGESESEIIDPSYRGSGYGSEAKHLLFDHAFNTLGLHMLTSWVFFSNTRSAAALRKQGYTDAGRVHWIIHRHGSFANMGIFYLRADDWRAMPRRPHGESA